MDIPGHILEAVQTAADSIQPRQIRSAHAPLRDSSRKPNLLNLRRSRSSVGDSSSASDSEHEPGYQTDFTSLPSDSSPEDMPSDEVEEFRDREYPQLKGKTYLDHGGTTLYARSLIEEFSADLVSNLYGNPHSASSPSAVSGHRVDAIRERALRFFNANPDDFDLIFVLNATAAIRMVIECFKDFAQTTNTPIWYGYHKDAHTSLVGVREATKLHRCFQNDNEVECWINSGGFGGPRSRQLGLFAYPGQSNMTGRRLPLNWCGRIRKLFHKAATYTLLDAAALASTAPLDLSDTANAPDFVALSFYKIFGFPNIGALIVRKDSSHVLAQRKYFGGGTVDMIITLHDTWHAMKETALHDRLEDGTLPFHSIFALDHAMNVHERLYGPNPMKFISTHTAHLGKMLYDGLEVMKHHNGSGVCRIYKDDSAVYGDPTTQGATVAFNVVRADGSMVGYEEVEEAADERNIFIRSGSLCNPGGMATYLGWSPAEMRAAYAAGHRCTNPTQIMFGRPTGVVRVSLGAMSTAKDVRTLLRFLEDVYVDRDGQPTAAVAQATQMARTVQLPAGARPPSPSASPGRFPPLDPLTTTGLGLTVAGQRTPISPLGLDGCGWDTPTDAGIVMTERPRFIPSEYTKRYKPWEEAIRKTSYTDVATTVKVKEVDESTSNARSTPPSVKARKFGRSVVNLLRSKNVNPEPIPKPPPVPLLSSPHPMSTPDMSRFAAGHTDRREAERPYHALPSDAVAH